MVFSPLPSIINESYITYRALCSKLTGNGALLEQYRAQNDLEPSTVGGVDLSHFVTADMSLQDIENLAKQMGEDAAIGRATRKLFASGKSQKQVGRILHAHLTIPT